MGTTSVARWYTVQYSIYVCFKIKQDESEFVSYNRSEPQSFFHVWRVYRLCGTVFFLFLLQRSSVIVFAILLFHVSAKSASYLCVLVQFSALRVTAPFERNLMSGFGIVMSVFHLPITTPFLLPSLASLLRAHHIHRSVVRELHDVHLV